MDDVQNDWKPMLEAIEGKTSLDNYNSVVDIIHIELESDFSMEDWVIVNVEVGEND